MTTRDYTKFFTEADTDNSGALTKAELTKACRKAGFRGSDQDLKKIFNAADASGDGMITLDEFLSAMGQQPEKVQTTSAMRYVFNCYDTDGNGSIDRSEVKNIWADMKKVLKEEELERVMSWLDKDSDGKIEYEEFLAYYQGN